MAVLPVIVAPDPRLKVKCRPVAAVDATVRALMDDMMESMHAAKGIGLAAPQVGRQERVIVVDVTYADDQTKPLRMANPDILWSSEETVTAEEGCLSLPEHYAEVRRAVGIRVRYLDHENESRELEAAGLLAACIQHEIDHLDGVLFVDRISSLKRNIILRKLAKTKKLNQPVAV